MNKKILSPRNLLAISIAGLIFFLIFSDPLALPLPLLLVPFMLLFLATRSLVFMLLRMLFQATSKRKVGVLATGGALILVFVVVLQSLGQLSWRDILLTMSFIVIVVFYFSKTDLV